MTPKTALKRVFDIVLSASMLLLASPIIALCVLAIHFEDGRPWFFRQQRVGLRGNAFPIFKLRSMRAVAGPSVTTRDDKRITRTGKFLRNLKLDELPQLYNVLRGDMSLVGPRPEVAEFMATIDPMKAAKRNSVRPGITGPASLAFVDEEMLLQCYDDPVKAYKEIVFPQKLELDLCYVEQHSLLSDFTIVFKTAISIIKRILHPK
jgi:lipopolysaccharide/colanic/teichoic acid biosynthesis glycosyltransferase